MRGVLLLAVVALLAGCGAAHAAETPAGTPTPVLTRTLTLARGADRPLPTTVWYPERLTGRRPIILFSHGLGGSPGQFAPLATSWAEAGYIVAAPAYPHTNASVRVRPEDVPHQPADAAYVLGRIRALDTTRGDVFAGHVDGSRVAAVGFSAGGTTTLGLLRAGHDPALRAAVSIAGRRPVSAFGGPAVPVLFLHGDRDRVVPIGAGRAAYAALPWPKTFITIPGEAHGQYLNPGDPGYPRASALILRFLADRVPAR
jgi:predicted dienelactone hydrolase